MKAKEIVVAMIPLRGGSKSIPDKNIKILGSMPLCYYVLSAASAAPSVSSVYVSTDSDMIADVVESLGLGVKIIRRPPELATDEASTEAVMLHFAENVDFDSLITLQATSPLTISEDIENALAQFASEKLDSLLTGVRTKRFYWTPQGRPLNYEPTNRPRRQEFDGVLVENGAFYITTRTLLAETGCRLGGRMGIYEMSEETAVEIDEPADWRRVEALLRDREPGINSRLHKIGVLMCDVDGTLTDGGMYYSAKGELAKKFNTRDAMGLGLLKKSSIVVVVVTREDSPAVAARMKKLGIDEYYPGVVDKAAFLAEYCHRNQHELSQVAFMGDDLNDLSCLRQVGFAACPADAVDEVKQVCQYRAMRCAGAGAVREVCDLLIQSSGNRK